MNLPFTDFKGKSYIDEISYFEKANNLSAILLDWDGVFNDGKKEEHNSSNYSEIDSMGINMLRFSYYLKTNKILPVFIITGEENIKARQLSIREHFEAIYFKCKNKLLAAEHIEKYFDLSISNVVWVFDDILDFSLAEKSGLRIFVKRENLMLTNLYVSEKKLVDYETHSPTNAVREACEWLINANKNYTETFENRSRFSEIYSQYLTIRNNINTSIFEFSDNKIVTQNA